MEREAALQLLLNTIEFGIYFKHLDRIREVAKFSRQLTSGEDHDDIITSIRKRESKEQKEQRIALYSPLTKVSTNQIRNYYKRTRRIEPNIQIDNDDLKQKLETFNGNKSLQKYLENKFEFLNANDPNAAIVINFKDNRDDFGRIQDIEFRPVIVYSEQIINQEKDNGDFKYIIFQVERIEEHFEKDEFGKVISYNPNPVIDYWMWYEREYIYLKCYDKIEVQNWSKAKPNHPKTKRRQGNQYVQSIGVHGFESCPVVSVGFNEDEKTNGETFVNIFDPAEHLYRSLINAKSERDLMQILHMFPQKFI